MNYRTRKYARKFFRNPYSKQLSLKQTFYEQGFDAGLAYSTIYKYWRWVRRLVLERSPLIHPDQLSDDAILRFVNKLAASTLALSSFSQAIDALRFLYGRVLSRRNNLQKELQRVRQERSRRFQLHPTSSRWYKVICLLKAVIALKR